MTGPSFLRANPHSRGQDDDFAYAVRGIVTAGRHLSVTCLTSIETPRWCQHAPCRPRSARRAADGDAAALHRVILGLCPTPVVLVGGPPPTITACAKAKGRRGVVSAKTTRRSSPALDRGPAAAQGPIGLCLEPPVLGVSGRGRHL